MAPSELAALRDTIAQTERTLLAAIAQLSAELAGYAATQGEHGRRIGSIESRCEERSDEGHTGRFEAARALDRYDRLEQRVATMSEDHRYWSRWTIASALGIALLLLAAAVGAVVRLSAGG